MKFLCGNCKAKYQIADEKVTGRTLRMKCRRCGHDILIDGHAMPASSPPPAAPAGARRPGTGAVSVSPARAGSGAHPMPPRPAALGGPPPRPGSRSKPPSALSADFRRHVAAPPEVPQRSAPYDLWHVAINDVPVGPMTREELGRKIDSGAVRTDSLCWREGMDDWRPLGELPELAQLLRRNREGSWSGRPMPRPRPPHMPPPQGARVSSQFPEQDELEEDYSEPTRIADLQHPPTPAPASSPRIPAALAAPAAAPVPAEPSVVAPAPAPVAPVPTRGVSKGGSGLTTGIALGLLAGILLVGGPMLYRNTWGSEANNAASQQVTTATTDAPKKTPAAARDIQLEVEDEDPGEVAETEIKPTTPKSAGQAKTNAKTDSGKTTSKDNLTDEQRRLLERMGGEGAAPTLPQGKRNEATASGPSLNASQLTKVVSDNKVQLQRCYETALRAAGGRQDGTLKITVSVTVGASGTTKSVSTQGGALGNMNDCIRQAVKRWRFPSSGGESEFAFPLVFQPGA